MKVFQLQLINSHFYIIQQFSNQIYTLDQFLQQGPFRFNYCLIYGFLLYTMSVNSTPRGNSLENIPLINPVEYFNAEKVESSIPSLAIKKIGEIIDQYFKLKPQLINKENQIKGLFTYNQKMMETIEQFMQHEKKVVKKYNKLCLIYAKNFKEYWNAKNVDVNFKDLMNPITSISENFSMNEWKIDIVENSPPKITPKYEEMLLGAIKRHFLNQDNILEAILDKELKRLQRENMGEPQSLTHIKQQLRQLNTTPPTTANMFDLLEKRKNIENLIKEIDEKYYCQFITKDLNFIDQVARIHSIITNPTPDKLHLYLDHEAQIRRSLKKKSRKFRESLELEFQRIDSENVELKEQIEEIRKKNQQLEESRTEFRNKFQLLELKQKAGLSKKQKNASNTSIIQDTLNLGMKQTHKKLQIKVSELESQIAHLKQELIDKQQINKHLNVKRELMDSNSQMEELRLKLCSKLMELGIVDTEAMTSGEMFDHIMQRQLGVKHYQVKDPTASENNQYIDIKITESLPINQPNKYNHTLQTPPQISQSIMEKQHSDDEHQKQDFFKRKDKVLESADKSIIREAQSNDFQTTKLQNNEPNIYNPMAKSQPLKINLQIFRQTANSTHKKSYSPPLSAEGLLSISQRKSVEQESKMQDNSKVFRDNKSAIDQKQFIKNWQNSKQVEEHLGTIKILQERNRLLLTQQKKLRKELQQLQQLLAQKKDKLPSAFESIEKQLKNIDKDHANKIEHLCQSMVRELQKFQGDEFTKMMTNIEGAIKNFKSSSSNPNMNQIPVLTKNLTEHEDNLFKSQNFAAQLFLGRKDEASKRRFSTFDDKSGRLSLNSGEVKFQIKHEKSIYFGGKDHPQSSEQLGFAPRIIESKANNNNYIEKQESSIQIDQDQLIDIVNDFEGRSMKKKDPNNSQYSLKLSQSNLKNSRQSQIKSSLKIIDKIDRKIIQDAQFMNRMQQKLQQIKNYSQQGHDLYWFYKRYRQAMEALESTQAKLKQFQRRKDTCMNQLLQEDANLSKHKLEEKIYFLQQKVKELEDRLILNKEQYETNMTEHIKGIDDIRQNAIGQLIKGIFSQKYAIDS